MIRGFFSLIDQYLDPDTLKKCPVYLTSHLESPAQFGAQITSCPKVCWPWQRGPCLLNWLRRDYRKKSGASLSQYKNVSAFSSVWSFLFNCWMCWRARGKKWTFFIKLRMLKCNFLYIFISIFRSNKIGNGTGCEH